MTVSPLTPEFVSWLKACQEILNDYYAKYSPNTPVPELCRELGKRYIKITEARRGGTSVWAFIDTFNGDVMKPASWRAPAKHARGNIFDEWNGMRFMTVFGPAYLR